ncbi:hypothetical protein FOMA001_g2170 [Fusarium oxysporum f. sp. matthiolae]|nr:hypothetical protein FOMA001_g2170 [Fusarium oxysporum f. sp. matthiolae]
MGKLLQTLYCRLQANSTSYCGTTKDFCGKKTVNRLSCSSKGPMRRVVGYIEGWASTRSCDNFTPSNIPDGVYTHTNFAFASINPTTFQIVPVSSKDPALYRELTRKKKVDPKLKVFIAIGGWAFNDPGLTVTTFSDIARSDANQRTFIKSLISFMATYGFDGVDIDWEYPAADDHEGQEEDFDNLPKFLSNIKSALKQSGNRNGLSIAIPASYWYLQHFDLEKISKYVDHFNVMSYDFHGAWDTPKSWLRNYLNSYTNLTEIKEAFDLLWRNKVDPDQVNIGLAFYACTFSASSPGCMSPGCLFDAGGPAEPCTNAVGVMSNPEIMRKLGNKIGSGDLDKAAAVKTLKFGRTWLTYDDVDTWKLKLEFAHSQCLGGAMVWAISQDTADGKFSKQLQVATGYKSKAVTKFNSTISLGHGVFMETTESEANADVSDAQCRWTNCAETCPSKWSTVPRQDPYRTSSKEIMTDSTGCDGNGSRTFCCPPGEQPFCQWLFHNNGACTPGCPYDNMYEVASLSLSCSSGKAQVACCRGDTPALDVYRQYKWYGKESKCATDLGDKECGWSNKFDTSLVSSWSGSGAQVCYDSEGKKGTRPMCEDSSDESKPHFTNCQWVDSFDVGATNIADREQCSGNCPSGKYKVTLDAKNNICKKGTSAYCCDISATFDHNNIDDDDLEDILKAWAKDPKCPKLSDNDIEKLSSRSMDNRTLSVAEKLASLDRRDGTYELPNAIIVLGLIQRIMEFSPTSRETRAIRNAVDKAFGPHWKQLTGAYIAGLMYYFRDSMSMNNWRKTPFRPVCSSALSDHLTPTTLSTLEDPRDSTTEISGPDVFDDINEALDSEWSWPLKWIQGGGLEKRGYGKKRPFYPKCPDKSTWVIWSLPYPNGEKGDALAKKNGDEKRYYVNNYGGDCYAATVEDDGGRDQEEWVSEHILELQSIHMFIEYTMGVQDKLRTRPSPSGINILAPFNPAPPSDRPPCSTWKDAFMHGFPLWDAEYKETPQIHLYTLLGSTSNAAHMVTAEAKLNGKKAKLWGFSEPVEKKSWKDDYSAMDKATAEYAFEQFQLIEQVFGYLTKPAIEDKLLAAHQDVIEFLDAFEKLYEMQYPTIKNLNLSDTWRNFMTELLRGVQDFTEEWMKLRTGDMVNDWKAEVARRETALKNAANTQAAKQLTIELDDARKIHDDAKKHFTTYSSLIGVFKPEIFQETGAA